MKRIIELSIKGVGLALALFAVFGLVADVANQGVFTLKNYNYTKMVIGAVIVGLGFSVPGIVYETTDFSYAVKILIHMGNFLSNHKSPLIRTLLMALAERLSYIIDKVINEKILELINYE